MVMKSGIRKERNARSYNSKMAKTDITLITVGCMKNCLWIMKLGPYFGLPNMIMYICYV